MIGPIHERGRLTVAAFMELALYHPTFGYYARAVQRSGRAGDFFTSVDIGPLFGELLARQISEMARLVHPSLAPGTFDLIEAGAGNGRLMADLIAALHHHDHRVCDAAAIRLLERSEMARAAQCDVPGRFAGRTFTSGVQLPETFEGVLFANELLDAMPVHRVVMRGDGLREIFLNSQEETLIVSEEPPSTPELAHYLERAGITLESGWYADISLAAIAWVKDAARRLQRGFLLFIDYGHEARVLFSAAHASGTLASVAAHQSSGSESRLEQVLAQPGARDLTAHVDFTSVAQAAASEGCVTLGLMDQSYFLLALAADCVLTFDLRQRLALKSLTLPGGLGSTMKVLVLGKNVGTPALLGCSSSQRLT